MIVSISPYNIYMVLLWFPSKRRGPYHCPSVKKMSWVERVIILYFEVKTISFLHAPLPYTVQPLLPKRNLQTLHHWFLPFIHSSTCSTHISSPRYLDHPDKQGVTSTICLICHCNPTNLKDMANLIKLLGWQKYMTEIYI